MIQCDIHVPDNLVSKFSEMSPLFGHVEVDYSLLSKHMQEFVRETGWSISSGKSLVGVCSAQNILLHSELLKWYLSEGLEVTQIHKMVRYKKKDIFRQFVEDATDSRREGDRDPSLSP